MRTAALGKAQPSLRPVDRTGLGARRAAPPSRRAQPELNALLALAFRCRSQAWEGACMATSSWGWPAACSPSSVFLPWYGTDLQQPLRADRRHRRPVVLGGPPDPAPADAGRLGGALHPRLRSYATRPVSSGPRGHDDGHLDQASIDLYNGVIDRPRRALGRHSREVRVVLALFAALLMTVAWAMRSSEHERARKPREQSGARMPDASSTRPDRNLALELVRVSPRPPRSPPRG